MTGDQRERQDRPAEQDGDLSDLNDELRVLLPGTTTLTAFLIILPFNSEFVHVRESQKAVYLVTFLCAVLSLILFSAPAAHHRLQRPLRDREGFKNTATRLMIAGMVPLSIAIPLAAELVLTATLSTPWLSWTVAGATAVAIVGLWWVFPVITNDDGDAPIGQALARKLPRRAASRYAVGRGRHAREDRMEKAIVLLRASLVAALLTLGSIGATVAAQDATEVATQVAETVGQAADTVGDDDGFDDWGLFGLLGLLGLAGLFRRPKPVVHETDRTGFTSASDRIDAKGL